MTLTHRERLMIIIGLIVVALVAYIFYFVIPYVNNTGDATKRYAEAQSRLNLLKTEQTMAVQLRGEIGDLNSQLRGQGNAVPAGVDHAKILLYLKKITDGRTENLSINLPKDPELTNRFLVQGVTLKFSTTYADFLKIIDDLKKNELYSRVTYLNISYISKEQSGTEQQGSGTVGPDGTSSPEDMTPPTPRQTADKNVLDVQIELNFFAVQPTEGNPAVQPLAPISTARANALMPEK
jgi:hypothetical protein